MRFVKICLFLAFLSICLTFVTAGEPRYHVYSKITGDEGTTTFLNITDSISTPINSSTFKVDFFLDEIELDDAWIFFFWVFKINGSLLPINFSPLILNAQEWLEGSKELTLPSISFGDSYYFIIEHRSQSLADIYTPITSQALTRVYDCQRINPDLFAVDGALCPQGQICRSNQCVLAQVPQLVFLSTRPGIGDGDDTTTTDDDDQVIVTIFSDSIDPNTSRFYVNTKPDQIEDKYSHISIKITPVENQVEDGIVTLYLNRVGLDGTTEQLQEHFSIDVKDVVADEDFQSVRLLWPFKSLDPGYDYFISIDWSQVTGLSSAAVIPTQSIPIQRVSSCNIILDPMDLDSFGRDFDECGVNGECHLSKGCQCHAWYTNSACQDEMKPPVIEFQVETAVDSDAEGSPPSTSTSVQPWIENDQVFKVDSTTFIITLTADVTAPGGVAYITLVPTDDDGDDQPEGSEPFELQQTDLDTDETAPADQLTIDQSAVLRWATTNQIIVKIVIPSAGDYMINVELVVGGYSTKMVQGPSFTTVKPEPSNNGSNSAISTLILSVIIITFLHIIGV